MTIKMVVTDLDGTLLRDDKTISNADRTVFEKLGQKGIVRVAATGRSLFSVANVIPDDFPFDYVVFSTGGGVLDYKTRKILKSNGLTSTQVSKAVKLFRQHKLDFSVHFPIPDNHKFRYHLENVNNKGFNEYCKFYEGYCAPIDFSSPAIDNAGQLLSIIEHDIDRFNLIKADLTDYKVIRTTSPIDSNMLWIEVFPKGVSKGDAIHWICQRLEIDKDEIIAIGNDYNDIDILDYAGYPRIVANGHSDLKENYQVVPSNNANGVSKAISALIDI